jgi:cytidine deaminase
MQKEFRFDYKLFSDWRELCETDKALIQNAFDAMENAYAPYSKFRVGAVALMEDGSIIKGNNQENIAYPSGLCAERVALFYAGANFPGKVVQKLVIVAKGELMATEQLLSPCGGCRQVMLETENRQNSPIQVLLVNQDNRALILNSVKDLLPFGFGC